MTIERELIKSLIRMGVSTTVQARVSGVSVDVLKNHRYGRPAKPLTLKQIEELEKLKELLK